MMLAQVADIAGRFWREGVRIGAWDGSQPGRGALLATLVDEDEEERLPPEVEDDEEADR